MKSYRCDLVRFPSPDYPLGASVKLKEDHPCGAKKGDKVVTSAVKMIDFERGIIVTKNSTYLFDQEEE